MSGAGGRRSAAGCSRSPRSTPTTRTASSARSRCSQIGDALDELAKVEPELAEIIELKFFCGFSFAEIAAMRGVSERTIQRNWEKGRLYLHHAIGDAARPP